MSTKAKRDAEWQRIFVKANVGKRPEHVFSFDNSPFKGSHTYIFHLYLV